MSKLFEVKGRSTGKTITVKCDYDSFLSQFYGLDEPEEVDGVYMVDDKTIESTIKEYPEVVVGEGTMKAREVITLKGWVEGSGWSYNQCYSDEIIEIAKDDLKSIDWDWYEIDSEYPPTEDEDTKIIVDLYGIDADIDEDEPLASYSKWASEIWAERNR